MNIIILGGAGFIGTNLVKNLAQNAENKITVVDEQEEYFDNILSFGFKNVRTKVFKFSVDGDYNDLLRNQDIVYHLVSSTAPVSANKAVASEIQNNVIVSVGILEASVHQGVKKIVFVSSGGTVYGNVNEYPIGEDSPTNPINSYGLQKLMIEKLLYLYNHMYGIDYSIVRLSNPYGPYQRPNGRLGAVTTFVYRALNHQTIEVYGDGSVVRDYIYIDDAVRGIIEIANKSSKQCLYNLGSGIGIGLSQVLNEIENVLGRKVDVQFKNSRAVDVPVNYLDINRYESDFGKLKPLCLHDGIIKTIEFFNNMGDCNK